jgi:MFS family permease
MKPYLIRICLLAAAGGFLFGFDTSVIPGVIEYISAPQVYNLTEISKGGTVSCIIIGCMIGCVLAGPLSTRGGRKGALIFTAFVFFASSLGCAFAGQYGILPHSALPSGNNRRLSVSVPVR